MQESSSNEVAVKQEPANASRSKVESLSEISKLFEQGAISKEEFNELKEEILSAQ